VALALIASSTDDTGDEPDIWITQDGSVVIDLTGATNVLSQWEIPGVDFVLPEVNVTPIVVSIMAEDCALPRFRGRRPNPESETFRRPPKSCGRGKRPTKWGSRKPGKRR